MEKLRMHVSGCQMQGGYSDRRVLDLSDDEWVS